MAEEFEFETVTLTDEEGVERDFDILATMELEGNLYYALIPTDSEEDEYIVLKSESEEGGEEVLVTIDDDAEFDRVAEAFDREMMLDYDEDDDAKTEN